MRASPSPSRVLGGQLLGDPPQAPLHAGLVARLVLYINVNYKALEDKVRVLRYVDVHGFIVLLSGLLIDEAGTDTLDLNTGTGFLLNVLDKHTLQASVRTKSRVVGRFAHLWTNNFGSNVEVADRF